MASAEIDSFRHFNDAESLLVRLVALLDCRKVPRIALRIEWRVDFHAAVKPPMIATFGRGRFESNEEPGGEILRFAI